MRPYNIYFDLISTRAASKRLPVPVSLSYMSQSNNSKQKGGGVRGDGVYVGPLQNASEVI